MSLEREEMAGGKRGAGKAQTTINQCVSDQLSGPAGEGELRRFFQKSKGIWPRPGGQWRC